MEINKRDRSALKSYFVEYALPTEDNFSELIDGMINQKDDGIVKQPGSPLSLRASGDASSSQRVLNLYEDFADDSPAWALSLNPRSNPSDPATGRKGLGIGTSSGVSRLFIDHASGQVGIGTVEPQAALHVEGDIICSGKVTSSEIASEDWIPLTLMSNLAPKSFAGVMSEPACYKDPLGIVHLRGNIWVPGTSSNDSGDIANNLPLCNLPDGYSPEQACRIAGFSLWGAMAELFIHTDGSIVIGQRAKKYGFTLDCISFPAASPVQT